MTYTIRISADSSELGAQNDAAKAEAYGLRSVATTQKVLNENKFDAAEIVRQNQFEELETYITNEDRAYWVFMQQSERPSFTPKLLRSLVGVQAQISQLFASQTERPLDYLVVGSRTSGTFSLGGDLDLFRKKIEEGDADALRAYGYQCNESCYVNYMGYGQRLITIALIQGDALGGGFELALTCDLIVAERQAKFGFPEVLFNLFPGMGAYSFLARRIGVAKTEEMIHSGNIYTAEELHRLGVVDILVDQDAGVEAVKGYIAKNRLRHSAHSAMYQVRRRVNPVTLQELKDVVDIWVETALRLSEQDLRRMAKISSAQDRSRQRRLAAAMAIAAE
ncbi:crotonase/enoyl-CoA hydratase family protein [Acidisoma sp.]|uniref:crotonase/enoyl-CoA hydratase family protein n=1 Tax=Acidisoma sp. TaxID=1872115 RepID=UPI003B00BD5F